MFEAVACTASQHGTGNFRHDGSVAVRRPARAAAKVHRQHEPASPSARLALPLGRHARRLQFRDAMRAFKGVRHAVCSSICAARQVTAMGGGGMRMPRPSRRFRRLTNGGCRRDSPTRSASIFDLHDS